MKALWALEKATVHEVRACLLPERPLAYTTVMTVMGRLVRKGVAEREKRGRSHQYRPLAMEDSVREDALNQMVDDFFKGSRDELRRHLENGGTSPKPQAVGEPASEASMTHTGQRSAAATAAKTEFDTSLL